MFDVSLIELAVIALVALLVLGPERLPRAARTVGLYVRKARQSWYSVRADIERELAADELKRSIKRQGDELRDAIGVDEINRVKALGRDLSDPLQNDPARNRVPPPRAVSNEAMPEQVEPYSADASATGSVDHASSVGTGTSSDAEHSILAPVTPAAVAQGAATPSAPVHFEPAPEGTSAADPTSRPA